MTPTPAQAQNHAGPRLASCRGRRFVLAVGLALATAWLPACRSGAPDRQADRAASGSTVRVSNQEAREARDVVVEAESLADRGLTERAIEEFERAIQINPELVPAYVGAGRLYQEIGDHVTAEARFNDAVERDPTNFDANYGLGLSLQLMDRIAEAVRAYLRALSVRPASYDANLNLATAFLQLGEPRQAQPYASRAVQLRPTSGVARVNLGAAYAAQGLHDQAVIEYQQAAELMELTPELLLNLADSLGQTGRDQEMIATLTQLIRVQPSAPAYERLGTARFRLREFAAAEEAFRASVELDDTHYPALNGVGVCLLNRWLWGERAEAPLQREAVSSLRRSLQIEPRQPQIIELVRRYGT